MTKRKIFIIAFLLASISICSYLFIEGKRTKRIDDVYGKFVEVTEESTADVTTIETTEYISKIKVYITGEVKNSGVYETEEGKRIIDVVEIAGGATEKADLDNINLAEYVKDAQHIVVPSVDDINIQEVDKLNNKSENRKELININTATQSELESLSGIGEAISSEIIRYREENGNFKSIEEIKNVSRIGDKLFNKIKDLITV